MRLDGSATLMLPRAARLRKERDFRAVFSRSSSSGRQASGGRSRTESSSMLALHVKRRAGLPEVTDRAHSLLRFGITISKKVAKRAHDRNRLKRRLSEIARLVIWPTYAALAHADCVIVARQPAVDADYQTLEHELVRLAARAGICEPPQQISSGVDC